MENLNIPLAVESVYFRKYIIDDPDWGLQPHGILPSCHHATAGLHSDMSPTPSLALVWFVTCAPTWKDNVSAVSTGTTRWIGEEGFKQISLISLCVCSAMTDVSHRIYVLLTCWTESAHVEETLHCCRSSRENSFSCFTGQKDKRSDGAAQVWINAGDPGGWTAGSVWIVATVTCVFSVCLSSLQLASCLPVFGYRICGCHTRHVTVAQHCAHFCAWVHLLMSTQVLN